MHLKPLIVLLGSLTLLGGCFDRDNNHPGKDNDSSKASVQMQQHDENPRRNLHRIQSLCREMTKANDCIRSMA